MTDFDDRVSGALHDAAHTPPVDTSDVVTRVAAKRAHRRRVRQVRTGALSVAAVVAVVVASIAVVGGFEGGGSGSPHREVAAGGNTGTPAVRVYEGASELTGASRGATVAGVTLSNDEGYVRGPLLASGNLVTAMAYDHSGDSFTFPPSAIFRFSASTGTVADRVDLQGEIEALSEGEGARFAQTRDKTVIGPQDPEFRVKRITPDGAHVSNPIPPPNQPAGSIVAGGGAVWVPVSDGVLRFDPATGAYNGKVRLPTVSVHRGIAVLGKGATYVTDGATIRRLDPGSDATPEPDPAFAATVGGTPVGSLLDVVAHGAGGIALGRDARTGAPLLVRFDVLPGIGPASAVLPLPATFDATALHVANDVTWVEGTIGGAPVVMVLSPDATRVERTLALVEVRDTSLTFTSRTTALLTSGGAVYRITL